MGKLGFLAQIAPPSTLESGTQPRASGVTAPLGKDVDACAIEQTSRKFKNWPTFYWRSKKREVAVDLKWLLLVVLVAPKEWFDQVWDMLALLLRLVAS